MNESDDDTVISGTLAIEVDGETKERAVKCMFAVLDDNSVEMMVSGLSDMATKPHHVTLNDALDSIIDAIRIVQRSNLPIHDDTKN